MEILAANIRKNANEGLNITVEGDEKTIHISQLADDTTLFLKNKEAIIKALQTVEKFGKCSGLKLNKEKTEGLWLGQGRNRDDCSAGIKWEKIM